MGRLRELLKIMYLSANCVCRLAVCSLTLLAITIDRYLIISNPFKYILNTELSRSFLLAISVMWALILLSSSLLAAADYFSLRWICYVTPLPGNLSSSHHVCPLGFDRENRSPREESHSEQHMSLRVKCAQTTSTQSKQIVPGNKSRGPDRSNENLKENQNKTVLHKKENHKASAHLYDPIYPVRPKYHLT